MSVTRVGATKQYSDNWDNVFGKRRRNTSSRNAADRAARKTAAKKRAPSRAKKKSQSGR
jgi:hypothetical protein